MFDNISFDLNIFPIELLEQVSKLDRVCLFSTSQSKTIIESRKIVHNNDDNKKAWESIATFPPKQMYYISCIM